MKLISATGGDGGDGQRNGVVVQRLAAAY
jgi:hypothetical protein